MELKQSIEDRIDELLSLESLETLTVRGRKNELISLCEQLDLKNYGSSKELANSLLYWYDCRHAYEKLAIYQQLPLNISLKPSRFHGHTVRKSIGQTLWKKIRAEVLIQGQYCCSICGFAPPESDWKLLAAHEEEIYHFDEAICELNDIKLVCNFCHDFSHLGRLSSVTSSENLEIRIEHFMKVNQISRAEYSDYVKTFKIVQRLEAFKDGMNIPDLNKPRLPVRYLIGESIPLRDEIITKLEKKNLVAHSLTT